MDRNFFRISERRRVGLLISLLRIRRGLLQSELASLVGIDASHLSRIESGKYSVGLDILARIASALDCQVVLLPKWLYDE